MTKAVKMIYIAMLKGHKCEVSMVVGFDNLYICYIDIGLNRFVDFLTGSKNGCRI